MNRLYLDETVSNQMLILGFYTSIRNKAHHSSVVDQDFTSMSSTRDAFTHTLLSDLRGEILDPALCTKAMTTLQPGHHRWRMVSKTYDALFRASRNGGCFGSFEERIDDASVFEEFLLITIEVAVHELLLVPFEMLKQAAGSSSRNLRN